MWCASQMSEAAPATQLLPFLEAATRSLTQEDEPLPVRICACRAIARWVLVFSVIAHNPLPSKTKKTKTNSFCPKLEKNTMTVVVPNCIAGLLNLITKATEETLHLLLEALIFVLKVNLTKSP